MVELKREFLKEETMRISSIFRKLNELRHELKGIVEEYQALRDKCRHGHTKDLLANRQLDYEILEIDLCTPKEHFEKQVK